MKHPVTLGQEAEYAVSSESVDGHSISYNTSIKNESSTLEGIIDQNQNLIKRFIGPFSPLYKKLKVV